MPNESTELSYEEVEIRTIATEMYRVWVHNMAPGADIGMDYKPEERDIKKWEMLADQYVDIKYFRESYEGFALFDVDNMDKISKAKELIECFEKCPRSHNRALLLGALEYITVALGKVKNIKNITLPKQTEFLRYISDYFNAVSCILRLSPKEFIDKSIYEEEHLFKRIELFCSKNDILPKIDENGVDLEVFVS